MPTLKQQEKFYTCPDLVAELILTIPNTYDSYLEPSAGNGAWFSASQLFKNVAFKDLFPEHPSIAQSDYLTSADKFDVVFGNPPYSLATKFINCAFALDAKHVCFLLPPSFKKQSIQNKINKYAHLTLNIDLPDAKFMIGSKQVLVPSVWQIWSLKNYSREKTSAQTTSTRFEFVKKWQFADVAVRRVGAKAGHFYAPSEKLSPESNLFLKFFKSLPISLMEGKVVTNDFSLIKSISKSEIIDYVEKLYQKAPDV